MLIPPFYYYATISFFQIFVKEDKISPIGNLLKIKEIEEDCFTTISECVIL